MLIATIHEIFIRQNYFLVPPVFSNDFIQLKALLENCLMGMFR